jgi:hypothetical protein
MEFTYNDLVDVELQRRIDLLLHRVARSVAADARDGCPRGSQLEEPVYPAHTADTIRAVDNLVLVGNWPLWSWLEYGTPPHWIRARHKQALWWDGARHPVREVYHPGTPEYAYMRRALYQRRRVLLP